jgi:hypothetical protein
MLVDGPRRPVLYLAVDNRYLVACMTHTQLICKKYNH